MTVKTANKFHYFLHISVLCVQIIQLATVSQAPLSVINVKTAVYTRVNGK